MKQIHKAIQALESDIGLWWPSWILLKKLKNAKKKLPGTFPRPVYILQIFGNKSSARGFRVKQINEAVQALSSAIRFWRPSWILLKKLKNVKKKFPGKFPRPLIILQIFGNNPNRGFRVRVETSGGSDRGQTQQKQWVSTTTKWVET